MDQTIKDLVAVLLGMPVADDLLAALVSITTAEACAYCNRAEMPPESAGTLAQLVVVKYNRQGTEGAASEGYSGVTQSYVDGYPAELRHALARWRKVKVL